MSTPKRLEGFDTFEHEDDGISHTVYTRGAGPGVLLMHELPGMVRQCVDLATVIANRGFTVFMPLMFGEADAEPAAKSLAVRVCISNEFHCFAHQKSSPITRWLRSLSTVRIRPRCPGPGIGAIGMCFSGGFVLSLFVNDHLNSRPVHRTGPTLSVGAPSRCEPTEDELVNRAQRRADSPTS